MQTSTPLATSAVTFSIEKWADFVKDGEALFPAHYKELALDQDKITLCVDKYRYEEGDRCNVLHIVTARHEGNLVGYLIAAVIGHLHYASAGPMAYVDVYFLLPEFRRGGTGAKMIAYTEKTLAERGVCKVYITTKVHQDNGALLEAMGWRCTDRTFTKFI